MKIIFKMNDFLKVFPQYEKELKLSYDNHITLLEESNFQIELIKDKKVKSVFKMQLGTKVDFGFNVIDNSIHKNNVNNELTMLNDKERVSNHPIENQSNNKTNSNNNNNSLINNKSNTNEYINRWEVKNPDMDSLTALMLRDDKIIVEWDTKGLIDIELLDYLETSYQIKADKYEGKNYIGEGVINWETITNDVKKNWDNSFFFLDKMNDDKFVNSNKEIILEKTKDNPEVLKEALMKSEKFFDYVLGELPVNKILITIEDQPKLLAKVWDKKIKDLMNRIDYKFMMSQVQEQIRNEFNNYIEFSRNNSYHSYDTEREDNTYNLLRRNSEKELKSREKEIKVEVENNKKSMKVITELLKNESLKFNLVVGLLKNEITREDFLYFEDYIIQTTLLREIVIKSGLYKTMATTKKFVMALNEEEMWEFMKTCSDKVKETYYSSDDMTRFSQIVSEEQVLAILKRNERNKNENSDEVGFNFRILAGIKAKDKELKKYLFRVSPKERFEDLSKAETTEEDVRYYIQSDGYLKEAQGKFNLYELKDIETVKAICEKHNGFLSNKKTPEEWKNNPEVIKSVLLRYNLMESKLSKENVEELSKDINFVKEVVKKDNSLCFYKLLPFIIKNNKQVSLALLERCKDIEEAIKIIPEFVLIDKSFNIEVIKFNSKVIKYLKQEIWDDKEFVLTLFSEIEGTYKEEHVRRELPEKIQFFLETFNVTKNLYTFFNNYYLQKKLESNLANEEPREKVKRLKI